MAIKLLSPAGSYEAMVAAVATGADAVYFGTGDFHARRGAKNFTEEQVLEGIRYCRLRGVETYVTLNTLLTDRELSGAQELILTLNRWGVDAVIVQDLGVARMVRALAPEMQLHASTQLTVHNLAGALAMQQLGFSRVVLARELSLDQIAFITARADIETEVFCHGALCMSYSGQCYLSSLIGARSGNRGLCAQPCRLPYAFFGEGTQHHLSLKDLSAGKHLQALERAGVSCLKIEGRMKRPEYVALSTHIYKTALREGRAPTRADMDKLETIFSREGFTDGYLRGAPGPDMLGMRSAADARRSKTVFKEAQALYLREPEPGRIPVDFCFTGRAGAPLHLRCADRDGHWYETETPPAEAAINRPTSADEVREHLSKTGGTVFLPGEISVALDDALRIPISVIKAMRRTCLDGLSAARRRAPDRPEGTWQPGVRRLPPDGPYRYIFSFLRWDQLWPGLLEQPPALIYLPLHELHRHRDELEAMHACGVRFAAVLPRISDDEAWPAMLAQLRDLRDCGVEELVCSHVGQAVLLAPLGFALRGDFGLGVTNSQTLKELKSLGLCAATVSFEMSFAQLRDLSHVLPLELIAYGRLPLMITRHCLHKQRNSNCRGHGAGCPDGGGKLSLIDKTGRSFPLLLEPGCRTTLLNSEKLYLADKHDELTRLGLSYVRLNFTTEHPREAQAIAEAYLQHNDTPPERMTRGLYYRGVQ